MLSDHAFHVIEVKGGKRVGYIRQTAAGRWMALSFITHSHSEPMDMAEASLGRYLDREVAMEAIELAWHVRGNPRLEDRHGVALELPHGDIDADAF